MLRLMITGSGGLLGEALVRDAEGREWEVLPGDARDTYVLDAYAAQSVVSANRPDVLVHCLGVASPERAEEDPERAVELTRTAARNVAAAAARTGCVMVFPSSYMVFDGASDGPYQPSDEPSPVNAFGRAVRAAEREAENAGGRWLVVRSGWIYGRSWASPVEELVDRARSWEDVRTSDSRRISLAWSQPLATAILDLVVHGANGVVHIADRGAPTPYDVAREVYRLTGADTTVHKARDGGKDDLKRPVPEPANGALDVSRAEKLLGRAMPYWKECLEQYLIEGQER